MEESINKLFNIVLGQIAKKERPADPFDIEKFPCGIRAGDNKLHLHSCPFCTKPPTHPTPEQYRDFTGWSTSPPNEGFYMFCDELSAREYLISGLCQDCQNDTFKPNPEDAQ